MKKNIEKVEPRYSIANDEKSKDIEKITFLPKILIISFVCGLEEHNLITSSVSFEEEIYLQKYIEKDLFDNNLGTKYKLYAIDVRVVYTKSSGNYYSYVLMILEDINQILALI